jgi:transposase
MIKITILPEDQKKLAILRYQHPSRIVRRRFTILYFKCLNHPHGEIAKLAGVSSTMIATVLKLYAEKGLEGVAQFNHFVPKSNLEIHREILLRHFQETSPATAKQAAESIQKLTGIQKGVTQTKAFLHRLGFRFRKAAAIPSKANIEIQQKIKKKFWSQSSKKE